MKRQIKIQGINRTGRPTYVQVRRYVKANQKIGNGIFIVLSRISPSLAWLFTFWNTYDWFACFVISETSAKGIAVQEVMPFPILDRNYCFHNEKLFQSLNLEGASFHPPCRLSCDVKLLYRDRNDYLATHSTVCEIKATGLPPRTLLYVSYGKHRV